MGACYHHLSAASAHGSAHSGLIFSAPLQMTASARYKYYQNPIWVLSGPVLGEVLGQMLEVRC